MSSAAKMAPVIRLPVKPYGCQHEELDGAGRCRDCRANPNCTHTLPAPNRKAGSRERISALVVDGFGYLRCSRSGCGYRVYEPDDERHGGKPDPAEVAATLAEWNARTDEEWEAIWEKQAEADWLASPEGQLASRVSELLAENMELKATASVPPPRPRGRPRTKILDIEAAKVAYYEGWNEPGIPVDDRRANAIKALVAATGIAREYAYVFEKKHGLAGSLAPGRVR